MNAYKISSLILYVIPLEGEEGQGGSDWKGRKGRVEVIRRGGRAGWK